MDSTENINRPHSCDFEPERPTATGLTQPLQKSGGSCSPLKLVVGVVLDDGQHGVTEHHVGVVEGLLHLHGTVRTPTHVVLYKWHRKRSGGRFCLIS